MNAMLLSGTLAEFLSHPCIIAGIVVAALGIALALLAKKIARRITGQTELERGNKTVRVVQTIAVIMILIAVALFVVGTCLLAKIF